VTDAIPDTSPTGGAGVRPQTPPIVAAALACENLTEDDDGYRAIVDPAGPYAEEIAVAHAVSSCMLFAAWLRGWRGHFVGDTIQNTLRTICGGTGRLPDNDNFVEVGAGIWWAENPNSGADEHVDGVVVDVARHSLSLMTLTVIAGGQRNAAGRRCIKRVSRVVAWQGLFWVDQGLGGRRVRGVLDA
jgi:hypothetical protein